MSGQHVHEEIPRSEGDLRIYWDERDGRIDAAWCQGTMYRGYEMILIGRHPEDALATTARLCGICSTSHVVAATDALENAWNIVPPAQAVRLRNLFLAAESLMSDARQGALFFGPGLCHPSFAGHALYDEIVQAFQPPFVGWLPRQVVTFSKRILGVITAFTQQWPHSIPFRPGGTTCPVGKEEIRQARAALDDYTNWYAPTILGGSLDDWAHVTTAEQFRQWVDQRPHSVIGLYTRYATEAAGLHRVGRGSDNLLSGGLYRDPTSPARPLIPGGVLVGGRRTQFDQAQVREHSRFSWFADEGPRHPAQVVVTPDRSRPESYSWATAPRYGADNLVMQLGPLAELLVAGDPLTTDLAADHGISAYLRQLVRWTRGAASLILMRGWFDELGECTRRSPARALEAGGHRSRRRRIRRHQRHSRHLDALGHPASRPDQHLPGDHAHHVEREPSRLARRPRPLRTEPRRSAGRRIRPRGARPCPRQPRPLPRLHDPITTGSDDPGGRHRAPAVRDRGLSRPPSAPSTVERGARVWVA